MTEGVICGSLIGGELWSTTGNIRWLQVDGGVVLQEEWLCIDHDSARTEWQPVRTVIGQDAP